MNRASSRRRILVLVAAGGLVALLGVVGVVGPLRSTASVVLAPVTTTLAGAGSGIGGVLRDIWRVGGLARDNARLERENAQLRARLSGDAETRSDNEALRRQLGLEVAGPARQVAAEVTALEPDSYNQFMTINRGSAAGLAVGQAVMSEGVVAGQIASVGPNSAKVMLTTDPRFALAARDADASGADGLVTGRLGGSLLMDKIDRAKPVKPGDTITTAGLGGNVPAGLVIGRVQTVSGGAGAIFQTAQVETPLRPTGLRFVFVVVPTAVVPTAVTP